MLFNLIPESLDELVLTGRVIVKEYYILMTLKLFLFCILLRAGAFPLPAQYLPTVSRLGRGKDVTVEKEEGNKWPAF